MRREGDVRPNTFAVVLSILAMFMMDGQNAWTAAVSEVIPRGNEVRDYAPFLFGDLVVHGHVVKFEDEIVPLEQIRKYVPSAFKGKYGRVLRVTIAVQDMLKGFEENAEVSFVARAWVEVPKLRSVGSDVIVALQWNETLFGGTYELSSSEALYAYNGSTFVLQGGVLRGRELSLEELHGKIKTVGLDNVTRASTAVFIGTVEGISDSTYGANERDEGGRIRRIVFHVDEIVEGQLEDTVVVSSVLLGPYWPDWRYEMPTKVTLGEQYYVFVKTEDGVTYVPGGVNGMFLVRGDELLYDRFLPMKVDKNELNVRIHRYFEGVR